MIRIPISRRMWQFDKNFMKVSIIAAIGHNREIGANNELLWHLPNDMQFFKETTEHHHVIMGRMNYESIPARYRPLPRRTNIVITRNTEYEAPECYITESLIEAIEIARNNEEEEAFVIGGGQIYEWALRENLVGRMYLTHVEGEFPEADTFFPGFNVDEWESKDLFRQELNPAHSNAFVIRVYDKKTSEAQSVGS